MNIQIYMLKRNFDVQKAERFFKERRIPFQMVDLKKHPLGKREIQLFAGADPKRLLDADNPRVKEHPALYTNDSDRIVEYIQASPELIRLPIIRNGNRFTIGADEKAWKSWSESP